MTRQHRGSFSPFVLSLGGALFLLLSLGPQSAHSQNGPPIPTYFEYATHQHNTLSQPTGLAGTLIDGYFYLFISDSHNQVVREFTAGTLSLLAGKSGTAGYADGGTASALFNYPTGLYGGEYKWVQSLPCSGPQPNYPCHILVNHYFTLLYVSDAENFVLRKLCAGDVPTLDQDCNRSLANTVSTVAGNHTSGLSDGSSLSAEFTALAGISYSSSTGLFYIADAQNNAIRAWDGTNVTTFAGTGTAGLLNGYRTQAQFNTPTKVTWDNSGNMYVVDGSNNVIRKIDINGNATVFAGSGTPGFADGPAASAEFNMPCGIVFDSTSNKLYVADSGNNAIRAVDLQGNVSTYAGTQQPGLTDGSLLQARFRCPMDLAIVGGFMYVSDALNNAIRRIDMTNGVVSTFID